MSRKRVFEPAAVPYACSCGESFAWARTADLVPLRVLMRGQIQPKTYVLACRACGREQIVAERGGVLTHVTCDVAAARREAREHDREHFAVTVRPRHRGDTE